MMGSTQLISKRWLCRVTGHFIYHHLALLTEIFRVTQNDRIYQFGVDYKLKISIQNNSHAPKLRSL